MVKFSVVTICLNAGDELRRTVARTLEQTHTDLEVIVKDGLSTDGCLEGLPDDPRVRVFRQKDTGIYDAMNQALEHITGDFVIFMNCGDCFHSADTLELVARRVEQRPNTLYYGACYHKLEDRVSVYPKRLTEFTCFRTMICHQSTVYSAEIFRQRRFDTSYRILADRELLWYLVCEKKLEPTYIDAVIADYQGGGEGGKEVHRQRNRADQQRLMDRYFSKGKQLRFRLMYALTFPGLRARVLNSPRLRPAYTWTVKKLYALAAAFKRG